MPSLARCMLGRPSLALAPVEEIKALVDLFITVIMK